MAGLGRAPTLPDPDRYTRRFAHCDVLIVGGGPAGLAAALAAAESGAQVMLCDEQAEFGGSLLASDATIDGKAAQSWLAETIAALASRDNVVLLPRTTAFGYFPHNMLALAERVTEHLADPAQDLPRERLWQVRAKEVVIADRRDRAAAGLSRQRPAGDHARRRGADLRQALRGTAGYARGRCHRARRRLSGGDGACGIGCDDCRRRGPASAPAGPLHAAALAAGLPVRAATTVTATHGRRRVSSVDAVATQVRWFARRIRDGRVRSRSDVRRHDAERPPVLAIARQAALGRHAAKLTFPAPRPSASDRPARAGEFLVCTLLSPTATRRAKLPRRRRAAAKVHRAHSRCRR